MLSARGALAESMVRAVAFVVSMSMLRSATACDCSCYSSDAIACDADGLECTPPIGQGGCQAHTTGYHCYAGNASRSCATHAAVRQCCDGESSFGDEICSTNWCTSIHRNIEHTSPSDSGYDCWAGYDNEECSCSEGEARETGRTQVYRANTGWGTRTEYICHAKAA